MLSKLKGQNSKVKTKVFSFTLLLFALTFTLYAFPYSIQAVATVPNAAPGNPVPGNPPDVVGPTPTPTPAPLNFGPPPAGLNEIGQVFSGVISVMVGLGFIAMLVLLLTAGFKYLISGGEPKAVQSAHYAMTWALLGLVFFVVAWLGLQLIENFTGVPVTIFNIKALCGEGVKNFPFCSPTPIPVNH